uniref:Uncharacterized protein n=1 Tax=Trypanosoma congolense (strain IL3000) TaxID=1068625 RepID=G0ULH7_TRYCI|nr:hypothetical protein, unlikely [Trypanosoma congolense IL3000]
MLCREACGGLMQPSMRHPFSERCFTLFAGGRGTPRGRGAHNSRFPPFTCFKALNVLGVSPVIYPSHTHTHTHAYALMPVSDITVQRQTKSKGGTNTRVQVPP